jgi:hypothetical protein
MLPVMENEITNERLSKIYVNLDAHCSSIKAHVDLNYAKGGNKFLEISIKFI